MEKRTIATTSLEVTPIGLGTWVIGGWMWGGADENDALDAIRISVDHGITLIDTAPIYGFGKSEQIVGKALKSLGCRGRIVLATKFGLEWDDKERIRRNCSRTRILKEIDDSLLRLQSDYIDIYQVHWPDAHTPLEETMTTLAQLYNQGKIKAIGISNFSVEQMQEAMSYAPLHSLQPPFNMFEQEASEDLLPFCRKNNIATLTYGSLCRGLLTGKFNKKSQFQKGDLRKMDPKFKGQKFEQHLNAVNKLQELAQSKNSSVTQLTIEWTINQPGVTCALIGARNASQAEQNCKVLQKTIFTGEDFKQADKILDEIIFNPVGPEFMAPPK